MRLMVLGGSGMLGHQLCKSLAHSHEVHTTLRDLRLSDLVEGFYTENPSIFVHCGVDARDWTALRRVILEMRPDAVLNAIGIIKQSASGGDAIQNIELNALLPHRLVELCATFDARFIHFSTDCVFSGRKGKYLETEAADAVDLYGRTKFMGEVGGRNVFTLRSSIIGLELERRSGLIEWFLHENAKIHGFTRAIYSGFTTIEMARIIAMLLTVPADFGGVYQVSSDAISKYDLLCALNSALDGGRDIIPSADFFCDRSLNSTRFRKIFSYQPPSWSSMIAELAAQIRKRKNAPR